VSAEFFALVFGEKEGVIARYRVDLDWLTAEGLLLTATHADPNFTDRTFAFHGVGIGVIHCFLRVFA
jgi:hypothetical protein